MNATIRERARVGQVDFESFYAAQYPQVYRAAHLATNDPEIAFDATQEAFKRAYARWWRLGNREWAGGWVMTTALNASKRIGRNAAREVPDDAMSDEIRDLLRGRANDVPVPAGDLGDVIAGSNARRWRNRAYSVGVIVLIAALTWATVPRLLDSTRDGDRAPSIADTPTPGPTETPGPGPCETVPFRPMYLPDEWSYELQESSSQYALGRHSTIDDQRLRPYVDIALRGDQYVLLPEAKPLEVMGDEGRIGPIHEGSGVEFTYDGCEYSLNAFGISQQELRRIAQGLRPTDDCTGMQVGGRVMNLGNGRFFGYIRAINETAVEFDPAEFLTGKQALIAARRYGDFTDGEGLPNDYYIVNEDEEAGRFELAGEVKVSIETLQDGAPGLAPADLTWLICAFSGQQEKDDTLHWVSPYWLTVKGGRVVEIEEQYLP